MFRRLLVVIAIVVVGFGGVASEARAMVLPQTDLVGGAGSEAFGEDVTFLPNNNLVVVDPLYNAGAVAADVGAVYVYSPTGALLNTLTGSTTGDKVGVGGILVLDNSTFLVLSGAWSSGRGAVTLCGPAGCSGQVSAANSLVGSTAFDGVGRFRGVQTLPGGAYVVGTPFWDNGADIDTGAATWCPSTGCVGAVSAANSLIGASAFDFVGDPIEATPNGGYIVSSPNWNNGLASNAGAVTSCPATGCIGVVSPANSLVGSTTNDLEGLNGVILLESGAFIVQNLGWDAGTIVDAGAVTRCPASGCVGAVSAVNSLVGSTANDLVGDVSILADGATYVVSSLDWDNGAVADVGAVTRCSASGCVGPISAANSLVGSTVGDGVGFVYPLSAGGYVVGSIGWDDGAVADVGAATFCPANGCVGVVSAGNSLIGSAPSDQVGESLSALSDGGYTVNSFSWSNGTATAAGAVTRCPSTGCVGVVSAVNSLVGVNVGDEVGLRGTTELNGGEYVVLSPFWNNAVGAATRCAAAGCSGAVSALNSLVGTATGDNVGEFAVPLSTGGYAVTSELWANGSATQAGAVTWCPAGGCAGAVSAANSLVGTSTDDLVGSSAVHELVGGAVVVSSPGWDNGAVVDTGAVTWCATPTCVGPVTTANSLFGGTPGDFSSLFVTQLSNGDFLIENQEWDNGASADAGAVTYVRGGEYGPVTTANSIVGHTPSAGLFMLSAISNDEALMAVGFPTENRVVFTHLPVDYVPLVPARLLDTRPAGPGIATADGLFLSGGIVVGGSTVELQVGGRAGVPADAKAVALNVTVTEATGPGFVTVFPCGVPRPNASSLNFVAGDTVPNAVIATLGAGGRVCLFAQTTTHLIVDVNGVMPATSRYGALVPARLLDTRPAGPGIATIDGVSLSGGVVAGGTTLELQVAGRGGVTTGSQAVVLNVTVTEASGPGFVTVFPCGVPRPNASSLNYVAGDTVPNAVIATLGAGGKVCLFAQTTTHLIVDVNGVIA